VNVYVHSSKHVFKLSYNSKIRNYRDLLFYENIANRHFQFAFACTILFTFADNCHHYLKLYSYHNA